MNNRRRFNKPLFYDWLWTSTLGWILGGLVGAVVAVIWPEGFYEELPMWSSQTVMSTAGLFLFIGAVQWIVLRGRIEDAWQWIVATVIGGLIALVLRIVVDELVLNPISHQLGAAAANQNQTQIMLRDMFWFEGTTLLNGMIDGLMMGGIQALILRRRTWRVATWIVTTAGAVIVALHGRLIAQFLYGMLAQPPDRLIPRMSDLVIITIIGSAVGGIIYALITGAILARLLPMRPEPAPPGSDAPADAAMQT